MSRILKIVIICAAMLVSSSSFAASRMKYLSKVEDAMEVIEAFNSIPENKIPEKLLRNAEAIAILPGLLKAGFVLGGKHGKGIVSVRSKDGTWSNASFISITGGSIGLQAGIQSIDVILVFKSRKSVEGLVRGKFTLGADASATAGPVGRTAEAQTDLELNAEIYSYSRSRGLFAGISLSGAVLDIDHKANASIYGKDTTPHRVFSGRVTDVPPTLIDFRDTLEEFTAY